MSETNRKHGHIGSILTAVVCVVAAGLLYSNRQYVADQLSVWQYAPTSEVSALADHLEMTDTGRFYFYASHPSLDDADTFNKQCARQETSTAILGCYNGRTIYIYNVTDQRLNGIREVTAAHEMLHAAYDRLPDSEKQTLTPLLEAEYTKLKNDKQFADRMAFYERTEPGQRDNELHSVIGTEVASISPALETHYKKYFKNREAIVALHDGYSSVFESLQAQSERLATQLTELGNRIEQAAASYNQETSALNQDIETFNNRAGREGGFGTQEEFQNERAALVTRVTRLNDQRVSINQDIARYETLRQELIATNNQTEALNRSINSQLAPAPRL